MRKIIDQSERRIQAHMDQRAHMHHQTDVSEAQARGKGVRRHVECHQRMLEVVGPTCQSADHHGQSSGPHLHRPYALAGNFLTISLRQFGVPCVLQRGREPPLSSPYKYDRGVRIHEAQASTLLRFSLE